MALKKIIGKGAQAEVFLYHGFAYKVYKESYPAKRIAFEKKQQQAVNKAGLCITCTGLPFCAPGRCQQY